MVGVVAKKDMVRGLLYRAQLLSEGRARLLNAIENGVVAVDKKGVVVLCNPAAERLLGTRAETVLGRPAEEVFPRLGLLKFWRKAGRKPGKKLASRGLPYFQVYSCG